MISVRLLAAFGSKVCFMILFVGLSDTFLIWFSSCLLNSKQGLIMPCIRFDWNNIHARVPLFFILGPPLRLLFTNNLLLKLTHISVFVRNWDTSVSAKESQILMKSCVGQKRGLWSLSLLKQNLFWCPRKHLDYSFFTYGQSADFWSPFSRTSWSTFLQWVLFPLTYCETKCSN